jgi:hypothetical protein
LTTRASLTVAQVAFPSPLRAGAGPISACHDAITVDQLMRLEMVYWSEPRVSRDSCKAVSTFSQTRLGVQLFRERETGVVDVAP